MKNRAEAGSAVVLPRGSLAWGSCSARAGGRRIRQLIDDQPVAFLARRRGTAAQHAHDLRFTRRNGGNGRRDGQVAARCVDILALGLRASRTPVTEDRLAQLLAFFETLVLRGIETNPTI